MGYLNPFALDNKVSSKKESLLDSAISKQALLQDKQDQADTAIAADNAWRLGHITEPWHDGDSGAVIDSTTGQEIPRVRLRGVNTGELPYGSLEDYASKSPANARRIAAQRASLAEAYGVDPEAITDELLLAHSELGKAATLQNMVRGQGVFDEDTFTVDRYSGKRLDTDEESETFGEYIPDTSVEPQMYFPEVLYRDSGEKSKLAGDTGMIADVINPRTGVNLAEAIDDPNLNLGYHAPYNRKKRAKELKENLAQKDLEWEAWGEAGTFTNALAGITSTFYRLVGENIERPLRTIGQHSTLSAQIEAYNSTIAGVSLGKLLPDGTSKDLLGGQQNTITRQDRKLYDSIIKAKDLENLTSEQYAFSQTHTFKTIAQLHKEVLEYRNTASEIEEDHQQMDRIVDRTLDERASKYFQGIYKAQGEDLNAFVHAAIHTTEQFPTVGIGTMAESIPYMLTVSNLPGAASLVTSTYQNMMLEYAKEHGEEPTELIRSRNKVLAFVAIAAERLGLEALLGKIPGLEKVTKHIVDPATQKIAAKYPITNNVIKRVGKLGAVATVEGVSEGITGTAERLAQQKDIDLKALDKAGIAYETYLGMAGGAGLRAPVEVVQALRSGNAIHRRNLLQATMELSTPDRVALSVDEEQEVNRKIDKLESKLVDPEVTDKRREKLEAKREELLLEREEGKLNPNRLSDRRKAYLQRVQQDLLGRLRAGTTEETTPTPEPEIETEVDTLAPDADYVTLRDKIVTDLEGDFDIETVSSIFERLAKYPDKTADQKEEVLAIRELITNKLKEIEGVKTEDTVLNSLANVQEATIADLEAELEAGKDVLSLDEKLAIRKAIEAKEAESEVSSAQQKVPRKVWSDVHSEVTEGQTDQWKGIDTYLNELADIIDHHDKVGAATKFDSTMAKLRTHADNLAKKADAFAQALEAVKNGATDVVIIGKRTGDKATRDMTYTIGTMSDAEFKQLRDETDTYVWRVNNKSHNLANLIKAESLYAAKSIEAVEALRQSDSLQEKVKSTAKASQAREALNKFVQAPQKEVAEELQPEAIEGIGAEPEVTPVEEPVTEPVAEEVEDVPDYQYEPVGDTQEDIAEYFEAAEQETGEAPVFEETIPEQPPVSEKRVLVSQDSYDAALARLKETPSTGNLNDIGNAIKLSAAQLRDVGLVLAYKSESLVIGISKYIKQGLPEHNILTFIKAWNLVTGKKDHVSHPLVDGTNEEDYNQQKYELFKGAYANRHQTEAIDRLKDWWNSTSQYFVLAGRGGTGKTTTINQAILQMGVPKGKVRFALPTHKAKKVIQAAATDFDKSQFSTLASLLGLRPQMDRAGVQKFIQDPELRDDRIRELERDGVSLIVVDEASMVSDSLVEDLLNTANQLGIKIVFMGDNIQLPPVVERQANPKELTITPIFGAMMGFGNTLGLEVNESNSAKLTLRMRQKGESPILRITDIISDAIEYLYANHRTYDGRVSSPAIHFDGQSSDGDTGVQFRSGDHKPLIEEFVQAYIKDPLNTKYIVFNNAAHKYTKKLRSKIRESLFPDNPNAADIDNHPFLVGERLMAGPTTSVVNKSGALVASDIHNGDEVQVVAEPYETRVTVPNGKFGQFTDIRVTVVPVAFGNSTQSIVIQNENTEKDIFDKMSPNQQKYPSLATNLAKSITEDLGAAYIINTHKAQGSTYKTVFVDYGNIMGKTGSPFWADKLRSLYVAVSRPTTTLVMYGNTLRLGTGDILNDIVQPPAEAKEEATPEVQKEEQPQQKQEEEYLTRTVNIQGISITYHEMPKDASEPLAKYTKQGIFLQKGLTAKEIAEYLLNEEAVTPKMAKMLEIKRKTTAKLNEAHGIDFVEIIKNLSDKQAKQLILLHEYRHMQQGARRSTRKEFVSDYYKDPVKFEYDAHKFALKTLGLLDTQVGTVAQETEVEAHIDTAITKDKIQSSFTQVGLRTMFAQAINKDGTLKSMDSLNIKDLNHLAEVLEACK